MTQALALLLATAGASFAWMLHDDQARAGAGYGYLLALVLTAIAKHGPGRVDALMGAVCTFGLWYQAAGLTCVVWFDGLSSDQIGVCDEGTGQPIGALQAVGLLVVAAEFLRQRKGRR